MSNEGKTVTIHYRGTLDDGEQFDSSYDRGEPITFTCMAGEVIDGFDEGVKDMAVGEKKNIHIEPIDAYGLVDLELIQDVPLENIPRGDQLKVGQQLYASGPEGLLPATVVKIEDGVATMDLNHPLAGKALNFELELLEVKDPE